MSNPFEGVDHDGETYEPKLDQVRLNAQQLRVFTVMSDHVERTLAQIEELTGDPQASISARLRDLRKPKFGGWKVRRRRHPVTKGLFLYKLLKKRADPLNGGE